MKLKTAEELLDRLDADLAWRRSELSSFHMVVASAKHPTQPALLRASVALLYAHWEGFVKEAAYLYLCFLASQRLSFQQLRPELAGLVMRSELFQAADSRNPDLHTEVVRSIRERSAERVKIPNTRSTVRTESNLSFRILKSILTSVGLDASDYEEYSDLVDSELVAVRNRIVHGEHEAIALGEWQELRDIVMTLMSQLKDQFANAAIEQTYLAWRA